MADRESSKEYSLYTVAFDKVLTHLPEHPERTAHRIVVGIDGTFVVFYVYPTRQEMVRKLALYADGWQACEVTR